ncbi:hypothetical protein EJ08DRAFT_632506 [Tothia fuscella]|uniref:Mitochondrial zinc maintenance protein 1, mitochondrial n=1 Tax=Tothia fuscella TaxID=1048955 RepID=A0A9P4TZB2_9PEZI|nr:hypothetical protein EJ08DRAFT_632506 [Tothia fuscella]
MALAAYRHLLRSARIAFQGDLPTLTAARQSARDNFEQNRNLEPEASQTSIKHAEDVAKILLENVVQGMKVEGEESRFKLRIHEHTERGDNDSIKTAGKGLFGGKCCSA